VETPTVGRIVHLRTALPDPVAAMVTWVAADGVSVSLTAFCPDGRIIHRHMVQQGTNINQWSWPPRVSPPRPVEELISGGRLVSIDHGRLAREG